jgi:protein-tyrosine phosphatase
MSGPAPRETARPIGVIFVCLGNICRSPLAEGTFRAHVEAAGLAEHFTIASAGTIGHHVGDAPDPRSVAVAKRHHIDISAQRGRRFVRDDHQRFDYIVVMDASNHRDVLALRAAAAGTASGSAQAAVTLLLDEIDGGFVPDPYYGTADDYQRVWELIHPATAALLARIRRERGL